MQLTAKELKERTTWLSKGYELPQFDRQKMIDSTLQEPVWIHFGAGNIFRGFPAMLMQKLLDEGLEKKGIIVGEGFDYEIIDRIYVPHDNLSLLVTLNDNGTIDTSVVASVAAAWKCNSSFSREWENFKNAFEKPSLQMVSFTITEKGYAMKGQDGNYFPFVQEDIGQGPDGNLKGLMGMVTALVYHRYKSCGVPLALCSMDNCSHNGEKLQTAVSTMANEWVEKGLCEKGFLAYLHEQISFPWSMIDKITPRPDADVQHMLKKNDFESTDVVITAKHTYIAPFVNAERPQYLVIEDKFPNGRPCLEKAGVYFTDRDTVNKVEKMKVCTCLNPLHTCLAIYGCLLGYNRIADEMKDGQLNRMVHVLGHDEGLPVVVDPGIIEPKAFLDEVLETRFPNPFMPDTPQRIACDTSQKLPIRYGETIKAYMASDSLDIKRLTVVPLAIAGWCRYLMGVDDEGKAFQPSPDPRLEQERKYLKDVKLGDEGPFDEALRPILSDASLFAVDLYKAGLADKVTDYFTQLVKGKGAVRNTLQKYIR
ncbi:MAG: mannitol dehydrogenase family protein [Spirochaetia bacterium]|jgi:fructuronate reductase|nr:mannitol dehydrogenase family protein [Spirochaetia bacterium]